MEASLSSSPHGPMKTAPVALAADHAGYELKQALVRELAEDFVYSTVRGNV